MPFDPSLSPPATPANASSKTGFFSIKKKLVLLTFLGIFLASSMIGIVTINKTKEILIAASKDRILSLSLQKTNELNLWLENTKNSLLNLAQGNADLNRKLNDYVLRKDDENKKNIDQILNQFLFHNPTFTEVDVTDPVTGVVTMSTNPVNTGQNRAAQGLFQKGLTGIFVGDAFFNTTLGRSVIPMAAPVTDDQGKVLAVLEAAGNFTATEEILAGDNDIGETGDLLIIDQNKRQIAGLKHAFRNRPGPALSLGGGVTNIAVLEGLSGHSGFATYDEHGVATLGHFHFLPFFNATLLAEQDLSEIMAPVYDLQQKLLITILFFFLLTTLLAGMMANKISSPILALAEIAKKIDKGRIMENIPAESNDEIRILADALNHMTGSLLESIGTLKTTNKALAVEKGKIETLVNSIDEGILAIDLKGKILFINDQASLIMNAKSRDSWMNKSYKAMIARLVLAKGIPVDEHLKPMNFETAPIFRALKGKKNVREVVGFKSGGMMWLDISASPVMVNGKVVGAVSSFRDITKERQLERSKSEFVLLASHQLRTPLTGIKWLLEEMLRKLKKGVSLEKQTEYLQNALESSDLMVVLVQELLAVSRAEAGISQFEWRETDLTTFVSDLIQKEMVPLAQKKLQKITLEKSENKVACVIDQPLTIQVLRNILRNALHYSAENATVRVRLAMDSTSVHISVEDEGIGVSAEDQKRLFEKFFRGSEASKMWTSGSGLGLYLSKKIIDALGGSLECRSVPGKGSTFTLTLPVKKTNKKKPLLEQEGYGAVAK